MAEQMVAAHVIFLICARIFTTLVVFMNIISIQD
jgi:hypothetical protein